jgi:hypothetical protein
MPRVLHFCLEEMDNPDCDYIKVIGMLPLCLKFIAKMDNPSSQLYEIVNLLSSFCAVQQTANASISALQDGLFGQDRKFETNFPLNTTLLL